VKRARRWAGIAWLALVALSVAAPGQAAAPQDSIPLVRPGDGTVLGSRIPEYASGWRVERVNPEGAAVELSVWADTVRVGERDGRETLVRVQHIHPRQGPASVLVNEVDRETLAPIRTTAARGGGEPFVDLRFDGRRVSGRPTGPPPESVVGLDRLRADWTAAYETGDAEAMVELYVENAVRMPYDAPAVEGREAIVAAYRASFAGRRLFPEVDLVALDVEVLGDTAIERGRYHEVLTSRDGVTRIVEDGKYVSVARRGADDRWRYAISIFNRDAAPGS
jgi:uncharacterized protein (TIGR02246 family)